MLRKLRIALVVTSWRSRSRPAPTTRRRLGPTAVMTLAYSASVGPEDVSAINKANPDLHPESRDRTRPRRTRHRAMFVVIAICPRAATSGPSPAISESDGSRRRDGSQTGDRGGGARAMSGVVVGYSLRLRLEVDVQLYELDGAVRRELTDDGEPKTSTPTAIRTR